MTIQLKNTGSAARQFAMSLGSAVIALSLGGLAVSQETESPQATKELVVIPVGEVDWGALNPARGDASPRAGNLWGDRTKNGPTGMLVKFNQGFASPPHIHNITYRGIVISGRLHNDDPGAEEMWLTPGSFWTQPAGHVHITAADAKENMAYLEIDEGPYLVQPTERAFDNGEASINVDERNLVWLNASEITWIENDATGVETAYLWKHEKPTPDQGNLVRLPSGFSGHLNTNNGVLRGVVVDGVVDVSDPKTSSIKLEKGGYFSRDDGGEISLTCDADAACIVYVRSSGDVRIVK